MNNNVREAIMNVYREMLEDDSIPISREVQKLGIVYEVNGYDERKFFCNKVSDVLVARFGEIVRGNWTYREQKRRMGE